MISVLLHPIAVLVMCGEPGWAAHRVLTPCQLYQDLAVGLGQVVVGYKVPFAVPSWRCHTPAPFTLWASPGC